MALFHTACNILIWTFVYNDHIQVSDNMCTTAPQLSCILNASYLRVEYQIGLVDCPMYSTDTYFQVWAHFKASPAKQSCIWNASYFWEYQIGLSLARLKLKAGFVFISVLSRSLPLGITCNVCCFTFALKMQSCISRKPHSNITVLPSSLSRCLIKLTFMLAGLSVAI